MTQESHRTSAPATRASAYRATPRPRPWQFFSHNGENCSFAARMRRAYDRVRCRSLEARSRADRAVSFVSRRAETSASRTPIRWLRSPTPIAKPAMNPVNLAQLFILAALWGGSFLFIRVGVTDLGVAPLMALRVGIGALFLLSDARIARQGATGFLDDARARVAALRRRRAQLRRAVLSLRVCGADAVGGRHVRHQRDDAALGRARRLSVAQRPVDAHARGGTRDRLRRRARARLGSDVRARCERTFPSRR